MEGASDEVLLQLTEKWYSQMLLVFFPRKKVGEKNPYRYQLPIRHLPLDICFFAVPALFLHKFAVLQSHHGLQGNTTQTKLLIPATDPPAVMWHIWHFSFFNFPLFLPSDHTDPCLPVVGGGLLKWLVELELDFGRLEGALGLHAHHPLVVHGHHQVGFGPVAHLPGREAHTCG